jgi:hypothetical protein
MRHGQFPVTEQAKDGNGNTGNGPLDGAGWGGRQMAGRDRLGVGSLYSSAAYCQDLICE